MILVLTSLLWTFLLFADGYASDLNYWRGWIKGLSNGITLSNANYPPVLLYWLWLAGKLWPEYLIGEVARIAIKAVVLVPVLLAHLICIILLAKELCRTSVAYAQSLLLFFALSPALAYNAPVWGQIDSLLLPFIALSILNVGKGRWVSAGGWFAIAIATKIQAIFVLPALLGGLLRNRRSSLRASIGFIFVSAVVWFPWLMSGNLYLGIHNAYLSNLDRYPRASIAAANLWWLIQPDQGIGAPFLFGSTYFTPLTIGLGLAASLCLWGFYLSFRWRERLWESAAICSISVFAFAPSMHERYLVPALVCTCFAALRSKFWFYIFITVSFISALNMALVHGLRGAGPWALAACVTVVVPFLALWKDNRQLSRLAQTLYHCPSLLTAFAFATPLILVVAVSDLKEPPKTVDTETLGMPELIKVKQSWGSLAIGRSVGGDPLRIGTRTYSVGWGTHANSAFVIKIPPAKRFFCTTVGPQTGTGARGIVFSLSTRGRDLWSSRPLNAGDSERICTEISGDDLIILKTAATESLSGAHANWVEPKFLADRRSLPVEFRVLERSASRYKTLTERQATEAELLPN